MKHLLASISILATACGTAEQAALTEQVKPEPVSEKGGKAVKDTLPPQRPDMWQSLRFD